jgi:hypothetical protein
MKAVRKKMAEHWQHVSYRHPGVDFDFLTVPINAGLPPGLACFWVQRKAANAISGGSALHMQRKVA